MDISDIHVVLCAAMNDLETAAEAAGPETKAGLQVALDRIRDLEMRAMLFAAHLTDPDLVLECALLPSRGSQYEMLAAACDTFTKQAELMVGKIVVNGQYDWSKVRRASESAEKAGALDRAAYSARPKPESPA